MIVEDVLNMFANGNKSIEETVDSILGEATFLKTLTGVVNANAINKVKNMSPEKKRTLLGKLQSVGRSVSSAVDNSPSSSTALGAHLVKARNRGLEDVLRGRM